MDEIRTMQKKSLVKKVTSPQELCSTKIKETLKTLKTGANDVVVVQQSDGLTYKATPLYIRYNKFIYTSINLNTYFKSVRKSTKYHFLITSF